MVKNRNFEKIKKQVIEFKNILTKEGFSDAKVLLFGSWIKGVANEESDIDVCVISKKFVGNRFDNMVSMNILAGKINNLIEVAPMLPEEFNDKYSTLAMEVKKWGIEI